MEEKYQTANEAESESKKAGGFVMGGLGSLERDKVTPHFLEASPPEVFSHRP